MSHGRMTSLAIELTGVCNQKCSYCYNDFRDDGGRAVGALATEELLAVCDRLLEGSGVTYVTLTGGEPMVRPDFLDVVGHFRKQGLGVQVISNGGLVTEANARRLAELGLRFVQVAINGADAETHEAMSGPRTFEKAQTAIRTLLDCGVPAVGCIVVSRRNASQVGATLDLFASLGVTSVALSRFSPAGYAIAQVAELLPSRSDLLQACGQAELRGARGMRLSVTMPVPPCVLEHKDYPHLRFGTCPVGTEHQEPVLGPDGSLRHCTLHTQPIGDARVSSRDELLGSAAVAGYRDITPEFCQPCPHRQSCMGGCGAASLATLGGREHVDPLVAQHVDETFARKLADARKRRELRIAQEPEPGL